MGEKTNKLEFVKTRADGFRQGSEGNKVLQVERKRAQLGGRRLEVELSDQCLLTTQEAPNHEKTKTRICPVNNVHLDRSCQCSVNVPSEHSKSTWVGAASAKHGVA